MAPRGQGKPLTPSKMERVAELIGMGLSHRETGGAVDINERTVARILEKPEYRKMADDVKRKRGSASAQVTAIIQDLLSAEDKNGKPDMAARQRGVELATKLGLDVLDHVDEFEGEASLLPGVVLRFPWSGEPEYSRDSEPGEDTEGPSAVRENAQNGSTLEDDLRAAFAETIEDADTPAPVIPSPQPPTIHTEEGGALVAEYPEQVIAHPSEPVPAELDIPTPEPDVPETGHEPESEQWEDPYVEGGKRTGLRCQSRHGGSRCVLTEGHSGNKHRFTSSADGASVSWDDPEPPNGDIPNVPPNGDTEPTVGDLFSEADLAGT